MDDNRGILTWIAVISALVLTLVFTIWPIRA